MSTARLMLIYGQESYLIDKEIERVRAELRQKSGGEVELVYIAADDLTPQQLLAQLDFSPLFALQRVVVIRRPYWLGKTRRKAAKVDQLLDSLADFLKQDVSGQVVIFTSHEDVSKHPLMKKLGGGLKTVACARPDARGIEAWIKSAAAGLNQPISPQAVKVLANSGLDMYYLEHLLQKLNLQNTPAAISEQDVLEELVQQPDISVFKLTDALLSRNTREALAAYYQLLRQGVHLNLIIYMIIRQFALLGKVKGYSQQGLSRAEIAKRTGARDFAIKKMSTWANRYSWQDIKRCSELLLQADIYLKSTGRDGKIVLETLIIEVCTGR